ncbi:MAG: serine/threonine protein kinase [Labilithrix sp.]|nr:serine/threonine protein kinase [Labilithrix sp.]
MTDLDEHRERARAAREALIGKTIAGKYILRGLLGHGGMGAVYEAENVGIGKRAAIKFVDPEFATDEKVVARFAREARAMSAIESAHIVTVFDAGSEDGRPYLVMELLRGEDLGERLRRLGRIPLGEAMHVVAQVLKGLARAHAAGIVHRDLKPDNVFLVKHDTDPLFAKIVDFGISKIERPRDSTHPLALTGRGTVLGTPFYMSPEQAQASSDVDGRTDLYSVGAILFECLTGRPPHTGESYEQVILSICMRDAPDVRSIEPSIPKDVSAFVARALTRDRTHRFASAERMLAALHEVAPEERSRVPLDAPPDTLQSPVNVMAATMLDGGSPVRSSRPSFPDEASAVSAATRLGIGTLESATGEERPKAKPKVDASPKASAVDKGNASAKPRPSAEPRRSSPSKDRASGAKKARARPIGTALITAALASLTGVGVTFGVISMLDKKTTATTTTATLSSSTASPMPSAAPTGSASTAPSASASAAPATSASAPAEPASASARPAVSHAPASLSTASAKPSTPSSGRTPGTPPRPSSTKPLDIQRDLP